MTEIKAGEPFGIEAAALAKIDWDLALQRVIHDVRTDFIYAPHLAFIFNRAGEELIALLKSDLQAGKFNPSVPLTIEVPKSFRIRVAVSAKRLGPSFSRPGSILLPRDRLFYQALADRAVPVVQQKTNNARSYSHRLSAAELPSMFQPTRTCWNALQKALAKHAAQKSIRYILKIDVSNFFGSINQHTLINVLNDSGYPKAYSSRLEAMLVSYAGERSSRGILQGIYPSDLFGNFYMVPVDRFLDDYGVASARYVDDLYIFVESVEAADWLLQDLIPFLRTYDLVLNEAKCVVMPKNALITEEPDLQELFESAVSEISGQVQDDDFDADYGFQSEWDDGGQDEDEAGDLELAATKLLFDSIEQYPGHEESIERFCLPLFAKAGSSYAVRHVVDGFKKRPSMSQIYASYLAKFFGVDGLQESLLGLLAESSINDWQKMWILGALLRAKPPNDAAVKTAITLLKDANRHDALRAVAASYVGRYGDLPRRKNLIAIYPSVSEYVQAAIYFSSRSWPGVERSNARASWGKHTPLNALITAGLAKKK